jgi:murein DD-endopeptidase MepM/ murein hydrolase activator NlpD
MKLIAARGLALGLVLSVLVLPAGAGVGAASAAGQQWQWPLEPTPEVVRYFEPPTSPYGPGHRGVDLAGTLGQPVLAIGAGRVTFAGSVAGRGVVVVDHGGLRSTYQPVLPGVTAGTTVAAGQEIGTLELVHSHCLPDVCLHLGVLRGDRYIDPLTILPARPMRLKPLGGLRSDVLPPLIQPERTQGPASRPAHDSPHAVLPKARSQLYARGWACR